METKKISVKEINDLIPLFDQYMVFYNQPSNQEKYKSYLLERLTNDEATVYIAYISTGEPAGFVLNYHSFSSVSQGRIIVLNDLYVSENQRNKGIASALIDCSIQLAKATSAVRIDLATAITNKTAQSLYETIGFARDHEYYSYSIGV